jgi:peptidoglycan hydrolase CwlO-like protein
VCVCLFLFAASIDAQSPSSQDQMSAQVDELKALVFALQTKLALVEKELGQEKARRADLELAELQRARETLDPAIKKKLGLPVPEASKPDQKPATPPKE